MDRTTRAQQRMADLDVSPAKLAADIERLTKERDLARRQTELAREELARLKAPGVTQVAGGGVPEDGRPGPGRVPGRSFGPRKKGAADELARERDEFLAALQRERAEFMNFKRRTAEELDAMRGLASESLIRKVLALADDFDLAIAHQPETGVDEAWVEGIVAIDRKLRQLLESEGVSAIDAAPGTEFDPREHEAVANVRHTGRPGGEIVDELRRGYRLRDRVIRPALVAVAEDADDAAAETREPTESTDPTEPNH
jgi:molecular chaperone GrpE